MTTASIVTINDDFIVCNKASGVVVYRHRDDEPEDSVETAARLAGIDSTSLRCVHRLDKGTSGLLVIARSKWAARRFGMLFKNRKIKKTYLALVDGVVDADSGIIDEPILACAKRSHICRQRGKQAITYWQVDERFSKHTLLRALPQTGRKHQIRIHLASMGHPVTSDELYGSTVPGNRFYLHAYSMELPFYKGKPKVLLTAPLPAEFVSKLESCRASGNSLT